MMKNEMREPDYKLLKISSKAFKENEFIPAKYTDDGLNISPPLDIEGIPEEAKCLAIILNNPDTVVSNWTHWLVWNIPVTHHIKENAVHGIVGKNDFNKNEYSGPCPRYDAHRYFFKVYALDALLDLPAGADRLALEKEMSEHIIAFGVLVGFYKKINQPAFNKNVVID